MADPGSITREAFEILVIRELRRAGIEPIGVHRQLGATPPDSFDLIGRLGAYDHRWSALIECRAGSDAVTAEAVEKLRHRADDVRAASALLFATSGFTADAARRAEELRIALFGVIDARTAFARSGNLDAAQVPAWLPEFAAELIVWNGSTVSARVIESDQPEAILERLRSPV